MTYKGQKLTVMASLGRNIAARLRQTTVASLKFALDAGNKIEKALWLAVAIVGTVMMSSVVYFQVLSWSNNPVVTNTILQDLASFDFPAITFCHRGNTRYDIVERLGNAADPHSSAKIRKMRNLMLRLTLESITASSYDGILVVYSSNCIDNGTTPSWCKVNNN